MARTIATFDHPRSEIIATGEIFDGASEVQSFYDENYGAFPDFSFAAEQGSRPESESARFVEWRHSPVPPRRCCFRVLVQTRRGSFCSS
jgi:hypothetical protein